MFEINKKSFGEFISMLRKEKSMTQKELASRLLVSDKAVSKWETGNSMPDEYSFAAEPPVQCGESHLSRLTEPLLLLC